MSRYAGTGIWKIALYYFAAYVWRRKGTRCFRLAGTRPSASVAPIPCSVEVANALFAASRFVMWSWFTSDKHCGNSARRILQNSASSFGVRTQVHRKFGEVCCHFLSDRELSVLNGYRDHETDIDICRPLFSLLFIECKL
jgi:hypothetical protein